jgi:hypothetical protein
MKYQLYSPVKQVDLLFTKLPVWCYNLNEVIVMLEKAIQEYINTNKSARQVAREFSLGKDKVTNELKKRGLLRPKKDNSYDTRFFQTINTEAKAYWLGFIYADGCVKSGGRNVLEITLSINDKDHLTKFKRDVKFKGEVKIKRGKKYDACRVSLYGKDIIDDLIHQGAVPRKSLVLQFPKHLDKHLIRHFIRGYFDGDGSIYEYTKLHKISMSMLGTEEFLSEVQEVFMQELGVSKVKVYNHQRIYEYKKSRNEAIKIMDYLYSDCTVYLERKFSKYAHLTQNLEKC